MTALSDTDRLLIARAGQLLAVSGTDAICEYTGYTDSGMAYAQVYGEARYLLAELAAIAGRAGGDQGQAAEDTRRLAAIRDVLSHFDWEYHDRQLALEAIERIAEGGSA